MKIIYSKLKKSAWKVFIFGGIALMLLGAAVTIGIGQDFFHYMFIDEPDLFETKGSAYEKGDWYTCNNNILFDYFASDDSGRYYLTNTNDGEYFGFYVRNKDLDKADQICDETYDYLDGKRDDLSDVYLSGKGYFVEMSNTEQRYLRDYIQASGYEVEDYNLIYLTFRLETPGGLLTDNEGDNNLFYMILGVLIFLGGIIMIIYFIAGGYKRSLKKSIKDYGILEELLDRDMATAKQIGDYFVGNEHLVSCNIPGSIVIPYNILVWVYVQVTNTKHTVYGIIPAGTSTSYQLVIYDRHRKKHMIHIKTEQQGEEIITEMYGRAPYFLRGYNDKFANAVTNNYQSMINAVDERRQHILGGGY